VGDFAIRLWSAGAERVYGHRAEDALGKNYLTLFVSDDEREQSRIDCESIIRDGKVFRNFMAEDVDADGQTHVMLTNCFRIWDAELEEFLQAEISLDITGLDEDSEMLRRIREAAQEMRLERQAADERMVMLERLKQVTTAITSHIQEEQGLTPVLEAITASLRGLTDDRATSWIWRVDHTRATQLAYSSQRSLSIEGDSSALRAAVSSRQPRFIDAHIQGDAPFEAPLLEGTRLPVAVLPLVFGDDVIGVIMVFLHNAPTFSPELRETLELFAQHAAIAMATAAYVEDLREQNKRIAEHQERITRDKLTDDFVHRARKAATPLALLCGLLSEEMADLNVDHPSLVDRVRQIERQAEALLEDTRAIASGLDETTFDLDFFIDGKLRVLRVVAPNVNIDVELLDKPISVRGIRPFVTAAVDNILDNAVEAIGRDYGKLIVRGYQAGDEYVLDVSDSGPGVPLELADKIFERGVTTKSVGSGYGLPRSREVVEELGGSVTLRKDAEVEMGATFRIVLPLSR
jgi:PAS domain S-box-containing protein